MVKLNDRLEIKIIGEYIDPSTPFEELQQQKVLSYLSERVNIWTSLKYLMSNHSLAVF
ncbi:hypothetical protein OROGR_029012 [Orobanche gracilis]